MAFNRIPLPLTGHTCIISLPPQYRHRIKQHIGGGNLFPISCKRNLLHKPPPPSNYVSKSNPKVYCFCRESPILQDSSTNGATGEQLHEQAREAGYEILRKCGTSSTYSQKLIDSARHLDEISFWNSWSSGNEGEEEDGGGEAEVVEISSPSRSSRWSLKKKMVVFLKACGQILGGCPEMFGTRIHKVKFKFLSGIGVSRNDLPQVIRKYTQLFVCNINKSLIPRAFCWGCREAEGEISLKYSAEQTASSKPVVIHVLSGVAAAFLLLSQANQVVAAEHSNLCQIANGADKMDSLPIQNGRMMRMRGMTAKNFDPVRYSGRWFEVASLKRGFAGQGQEDCHCTQGVYTFDMETPAIQVDTFCVHGGPDGYITGIRGRVQCLSEEDTEKDETDLERQEMIKEKCYLRFPTLPFIPKEPYDVIDTDYDNFSLVSGSKDRGFIQIYSRRPDPGREFIDKYKSYLEKFGYDPSKIKDTPQDCEVMSNAQLAAMMSMSGMQQALTNQFPDLQLNAPIEFNPFTSVFDTLKKLIELYFKQ